MSCQPRYATPRTASRDTLGGQVAKIAEKLGTPLMDWQRQVADVALEISPSTGLPAYREVCIAVPRQSGKTTLCLALELHRALSFGRNQLIAYTAQTGFDARKKLMDDQIPIVQSSSLSPLVDRVYRSNGNESIIFTTGSRIISLPNTPTAAHGKSVSLAIIDEAFADDDERREQALLPAMATKRDGQLYVISTAGTPASVYFKRKVDQGRKAAENKVTSGYAYFEWSAKSEDDPDDPATWWSCMPALGNTIDEAVVRHARSTMTDGEFRRAMLNQWTQVEDRLIPARLWAAVSSKTAAPSGTLSFAIDASLDRSSACIFAGDAEGNLELVDHRAGVSWVTDRALELYRRHKAPLVVDSYSPAGALIERLEKGGVEVVRYSLRDMVNATGLLYDAILDGNVKVRINPLVDAAVAGAKKKPVGQAWLWARASLETDLTPLFAMTLAYHHATNRQKERPRSMIY